MIDLAHGSIVPGGPGVLLLVAAAGFFATAVYLFVTKGPPRTILMLVLASIAIAIGSVAAPDSPSDVHVVIEEPADGATVPAGREIEVRVSLTGASLPSSERPDPSAGHLHVLVDGAVVSMTDALVTDVLLEPGPHTIEAEFVSASHAPLSPRVLDRADVTARAES